jgi:hypothetical protein
VNRLIEGRGASFLLARHFPNGTLSALEDLAVLTDSCESQCSLPVNSLASNSNLSQELASETVSTNLRKQPLNDLLFEGLITFSEATRFCPRRRKGRKVHASTIYRWAIHGCGGIYLEAVKTPSGLCTSIQAIQRFLNRLTMASKLPRQQPTQPQNDSNHEAVELELQKRFGI